ncbi:MAG TPA: hypothetical protein VK553_10495 [Candidatus Nitrosopolaris rasttigaisensis]|nr:hypothetical protein [Candidatus Nitrosopolaris rasttigaisensis]
MKISKNTKRNESISSVFGLMENLKNIKKCLIGRNGQAPEWFYCSGCGANHYDFPDKTTSKIGDK